MMTPELEALARRAVVCPRWRWLPGMLAVEWAVPGMGLTRRPMRVDDYWHAVGVCVPDLTDPATAGCLLAALVAADPGAGWGVSCGPDVGWRATSCDHDLSGATCGEAVARALLVVWEVAS